MTSGPHGAACSTDPVGPHPSNGGHVDLDDPGRGCVVPAGATVAPSFDPTAPVTVASGGQVSAVVDVDVCWSSSCDVDRVASCALALDGTTLTLTTTVSWRFTGSDVCTTDCGRPGPTCTSEPLADGTYTLRYANMTTIFEVPSTGAPPCLGDPSRGAQ